MLKIWTVDNLDSSQEEENTIKYIILITRTDERLGIVKVKVVVLQKRMWAGQQI